jgi:hypothetical protein
MERRDVLDELGPLLESIVARLKLDRVADYVTVLALVTGDPWQGLSMKADCPVWVKRWRGSRVGASSTSIAEPLTVATVRSSREPATRWAAQSPADRTSDSEAACPASPTGSTRPSSHTFWPMPRGRPFSVICLPPVWASKACSGRRRQPQLNSRHTSWIGSRSCWACPRISCLTPLARCHPALGLRCGLGCLARLYTPCERRSE